MTNAELCRKYMTAYGYVSEGKMGENILAPLLPFILMDIAYDQMNRSVKSLDLKRDMKKARANWYTCYKRFNDKLFKVLSEDERDEFIDKMDDFEQSIEHDLMITKISAMECLPDRVKLADEEILSSVLLANIMSQMSESLYGEIFKTSLYRYSGDRIGCSKVDNDLHGTRVWAREFSRMYLDQLGIHEGDADGYVPDKKYKRLDTSCDVLCKKAIKWLKEQ